MTSEQSFWARRLHSLTGVIPIGAFLFEHMLTNSKAIHGKVAYNDAVAFIQSLPYLLFLEIFFIGLPLLFHAGYGVYIGVKAKPNPTRYPFFRNWMYTLQRLSGLFLFVYVGVHVWQTRIAAVFDPMIKLNFFDVMVQKFENPLYVAFYAVGILSAAFHFANGLWTFLIVWGVTVGEKAQRMATIPCYSVGAAIVWFGFDSIRGFLSVGGM